MPVSAANPGDILKISGCYWQSLALHAAVTLDVFTPLAAGPAAAGVLAERLKTDPRALGVLLDAMTALELLVKKDGEYALTEAAAKYLVKGEPADIGFIIRHHRNLVPSWAGLDHCVATGAPSRHSASHTEQGREDFLLGMFNMAMGIAPRIAPLLDLSGRTRLLDLGGGPGTYAIHFCLAHKGLSATIFDLPESRPFAARTIERFGVADRVDFHPGDYLAEPLPGGFDAAWLSQILHGEGPEDCRDILAKAVDSLDSGGILYVHEFFLNDAKDGPAFPALFSLNMLVQTPSGRAYSFAEIAAMLREVGLTGIARMDFTGPNDSAVLSGIKR